jgi:hypothetical protein
MSKHALREFLKGPLFLDEEKIFYGPKVSRKMVPEFIKLNFSPSANDGIRQIRLVFFSV